MAHTGGGDTEAFAKKAFGDNTQIISAAGAGQLTPRTGGIWVATDSANDAWSRRRYV